MATALLIIDLQRSILVGLASAERHAAIAVRLDAVAARLGALKREAEAAGVPVILVQHDGDAGHRLEHGTPGWLLRDEIAPRHDTVVVHKRSCDAFHDTPLRDHLSGLRIDHLVIGGCMTEFCIDTTCRRAVSEGYDVTLIADGHATSDSEALHAEQIVDHHNRLLSYFSAGANVVTVRPSTDIRF